MKIRLVAVGKLKEKYWTMAVQEYAKRILRFAKFEVVEVPECKTVQEEGKEIIKRLSGVVLVTDINAKMTNSVEFAQIFAQQMVAGKSEFSIVIGGSDGLCDQVKQRADFAVSFGQMTYPHQLMRVMVAEQVYRAIAINNNITYHK